MPSVAELERNPHAVFARLRETDPVAWIEPLGAWVVLRRDLALGAMRDSARFTVEDPRFTTAQVIGPSMLSLDGAAHDRHRAPFAQPFRLAEVRERFTDVVAEETERLVAAMAPAGEAELRRAFAGPLAAVVVTHALGLDGSDVGAVLGWYEAIVGSVTEATAGRPLTAAGAEAFAALGRAVQGAIDAPRGASLVAE